MGWPIHLFSFCSPSGTLDLYTVSKDGTLLVWRHREEEAPVMMAVEPAAGDSNDESDDSDESGSGSESGEGSEAEQAVTGPVEPVMVPKWSLTKEDKYGNFDIIFPTVSCAFLSSSATPHATLDLVPMLIGRWLVLGIRCVTDLGL